MARRVYIPATMRTLRDLAAHGVAGLCTDRACAVTSSLRSMFPDCDDEEVLSFYAFDDAALLCAWVLGRILEEDNSSSTSDDTSPVLTRRVLLACDLPDAVVREEEQEGSSISLACTSIRRDQVRSLHLDLPEAADDMAQLCSELVSNELSEQKMADLNEHLLAWYDPSELEFIVPEDMR